MLNRLRVPYAIVGAFAASFYGVVRASMDADAIISLHPGQTGVTMLLDAFRAAGLKSAYRKGDLHDPVGAVINAEDHLNNRVDLLMNIRGMTEAVFSRTIEAEFMKTRVRLIGVEDFVAMKILAGGPTDLHDAAGVLHVSYDRIHLPLLNELVQAYGKDACRKLQTLLEGHRP